MGPDTEHGRRRERIEEVNRRLVRAVTEDIKVARLEVDVIRRLGAAGARRRHVGLGHSFVREVVESRRSALAQT